MLVLTTIGDGLDNTCDDDKQIDECEEDIFPPEIDTTDAMLWCSNKIFPVPQDAIECFSSLVTAVDDCKDVELTVTASSITPGQAIIELKAVALGCGNRPEEDTTIIEVPVIIDEVELLRGYGCDGIDNNQNGFDNSITLDQAIDECAEDIFPPQIDASEAINQCANKIFDGATEAVDCFGAPGLVSAVDDCREVDIKIEEKEALDACTAVVGITAIALGCGNRALEDTTELDFPVPVDNDPPVVSCILGTQGLRGTGAGVFTDLNFSFTAVDGGSDCTETKDLSVKIEVLSNEVVATGEEVSYITCRLGDFIFYLNLLHSHDFSIIKMVVTSDPDSPISIWAEDHTCKSSNNGKCKVSSPKKLREYVVRVTATDKAGNSNTTQCNTIVGGEQSDIVDDPLFVIAKLNIVGGVEPEEDQDSEIANGEETPWEVAGDTTINPLSGPPSSAPTKVRF